MRSRIIGVLALSLAAAACSSSSDAPSEPQPEGASVVVENYNWMDVTVYAIRNGARQRLGTVGTSETRRFQLPSTVISGGGQVQLLVDSIGSAHERLMPPITVTRGDRVSLEIMNQLALSSISVHPRGW